MKSKFFWQSFRILITCLVLIVILRRINLDDFLQVIKQINKTYFIAAFLILIFTYFLHVHAWKILLVAQGITVSFFKLLALYSIGLFFNNFLPSSFGGDIMKGYLLLRHTHRGVDSAISIVAIRFVTIFALLLIGIIASALGRRVDVYGSSIFLICLLALVAFILITFNSALLRKINTSPKTWWQIKAGEVLGQAYNSISSFKNNPSVMAKALFLALIFQFVSILIPYCLSLSLGLQVPFQYFLILVPLVRLAILLPISINGLGVREGVYMALFAQVPEAGVSPLMAFSISILGYFMLVSVSLVGGILYLFNRS